MTMRSALIQLKNALKKSGYIYQYSYGTGSTTRWVIFRDSNNDKYTLRVTDHAAPYSGDNNCPEWRIDKQTLNEFLMEIL